MKHTTTLEPNNPNQCREAMSRLWVEVLKPALADGRRIVVTAKTETRSLAQNAIMWSCLTDISRQVEWHGQKLQPEAWKALHAQTAVPLQDAIDRIFGIDNRQEGKRRVWEWIKRIRSAT